ncbi:hypothetical protein [Ktedonobacter sp. SOSP1-85]|uniref:hypothetical protein n=1 Tax=Ktedonobacter sp. SOSP1-85 TaxID=2778367 RepID=UPI001915B5B8|nr:hypothetical protein [Ktedonobacter sp. SOSP1-85]
MQNHGSSDAVTNYPGVAEPLETSVQQHLERVSGSARSSRGWGTRSRRLRFRC